MELIGFLVVVAAGAALVASFLRTRAERIDPVCGMAVDADTPYACEHRGRRYRFCTRSCLTKFQAAPERWLDKSLSADEG